MKLLTAITFFLGYSLYSSPTSLIKQGPREIDPEKSHIGRWIPDLPFVTVDGKKGKLSDFKNKKALVIAFTGTSCPISKRFAPTLAGLEKEYSSKKISFIFIDPFASLGSVEKLRTLSERHNLTGPIIQDHEQSIARVLGAQTTTDTFVLDSARTLLFRGPVSDQYGIGYQRGEARRQFLRDALESILNGKQIESPALWAPGCELDITPSSANKPNWTYHNRISRIISANCVECHRIDGVAPFSLEQYDEVKENAGMIRKVVSEGIMPPWFASPPPPGQHSLWANDRTLSAADKADLLSWIQNGKPEGNPLDAPLTLNHQSEWNIGLPDAVFALPRTIQVQATGVMPYINLKVKTNFSEDRWIQATEVRPTSPEVVHHVLVFASGENGDRKEDAGALAAYVPGNTFVKYPPGVAKKLSAGATLFFQMHYTPTGEETTDRTRIGFRFATKPPERVIQTIPVANHRIDIPPHKANHLETAFHSVHPGTVIRAFMPHMHLRGKAIKYELLHEGKKETLLNVPHYDFNWQLRYELKKPRPLPEGSRIQVTGIFDNSLHNPANPDPDARVRWGDQSEDEMLIGYLECEFEPHLAERRTSDEDTALFTRLDKNMDGFLTKNEFTKPELFNSFDSDRDGRVSLQEGKEGMARIKKRKKEQKNKQRGGLREILDRLL